MKVLRILLVSIFTFALLAACSSDEQNNGDTTGRLLVRLTDAPFPHDLVAEANVIISKIDARLKSEAMSMESDSTSMESDSTSMDEEESGSPFILLMEEEVEVNLLELTNGLTTTLVDAEIPAGSYDLVRVYVTGVNVIL